MSDQPLGPGWWQASDLKWYPPQGPPDTPPDPGRGKGRRSPWLTPVAALLVVAVLAAGATFAVLGRGDAAEAATVALEPAASAGPDPFTESVSIVEVAEFPDTVRAVTGALTDRLDDDPATGTLVATGTTPGLYGGTRDDAACDAEQLAEYLDAEPDKAAAWSRVAGIEPAQIGSYLAALAPVVLTTDTWVTNHGFADGSATPRSAVLQAGTAVMVDDTGTPRVRCSCGNPLAPAPRSDLRSSTVTGDAWSGYSAESVAVVRPGPATGSLTVVDTTDGDTFPLPVGATATTTTTATPTTTAVPVEPITLEELGNLTITWPDRREPNPITLVDGDWRSPDGFGGTSVFERVVGDLDGDGIDDGAVILRGSGGGNAEWSDVFVVLAADRVPRWIDHESVVQSYWASAASELAIGAGRLEFRASRSVESDPRCCASGAVVLTYSVEGGTPVLDAQRPAGG